MAPITDSNSASKDKNEWTVMFFFASDNPLAPMVVSQIKAIKDAGFQEHTEVLVHFDPMERGASTKIFNVNQKRKADAGSDHKTFIGDGKDPFVRNMSEDEIDRSTLPAGMQTVGDSITAEQALRNFVKFGLSQHPAENFILILVGHGMIVGNDTFLPDDNPVSSITLLKLHEILELFKDGERTRLQLLGLNSCSMSSIEVAYQLRGAANYMLATQGLAFVNSWPYRQMLKKTFNLVEKTKNEAREQARREARGEGPAMKNAHVDVTELVEKLYFLCLFNFTDFMSAGYSADLTLCSLQKDNVERIREPLQKLVKKLKEKLTRVTVVKDLVLLAHWESQSFFEENYTDLDDFCRCLTNQCEDTVEMLRTSSPLENGLIQDLAEVSRDCEAVTKVLDVIKSNKRDARFKGLVIHSDNFGSLYQYARGLSVYFPWSEPLDDQPALAEPEDAERGQQIQPGRSRSILEKYGAYAFTKDFGDDSWLNFLKTYFKETKRTSRREEDKSMFDEFLDTGLDGSSLTNLINRAEETFFSGLTLAPKKTPELKKTPETGDSCTCPSIKNFPTDPQRMVRQFSITPGALRAFRASHQPDDDE